jgi:hypothetical protein
MSTVAMWGQTPGLTAGKLDGGKRNDPAAARGTPSGIGLGGRKCLQPQEMSRLAGEAAAGVAAASLQLLQRDMHSVGRQIEP